MVQKRWFSLGTHCLSEVVIFQASDAIGSDIDKCCLGCGRFFEGTPAEMHTALNKTLAALPDDTKVYVSVREWWLQRL